ncbi:hypothetical protein FNF27_07432 [Cafeteria roenbergensis]|uniref:Uncharacterized protein n=1 Tax=Cafeteria roenbergensis TaxID=33653 RepID=A0A5A8DT02_CAFRO|nr:hypothetical protein FNF27_07432 [Cafeteria roenbergensis]
MDMEIDVSERIVARQAVVGASWTTMSAASAAVLPVVTTEQRVQVFNQVRSRRLWAVQDDRLLVTWAEEDASIDAANHARLPSSALSVLSSRFLDAVVVVHKNGSVGLYTAPTSSASAPECLARTPARPDGRRLRWARLVALKGSETGTYLLIAVAQHPSSLAASADARGARLVVYRIVSRRAAAARAEAGRSAKDGAAPAAAAPGTLDVSVELSADHDLPTPPGSQPGAAVVTACLHKALLRLTVVWESGAVQSLAFPVRPLWYLARPEVAWTRLLDAPQRAILRCTEGSDASATAASAAAASDAGADWPGAARAFAVEPGCLVLVAAPKPSADAASAAAADAGKAAGLIVSVWDARHGIAVAQRLTTVAGDDGDASAALPAEADAEAAAPSRPAASNPPPAASGGRVRRRRSSSVVDPSILSAPPASAPSTASAHAPPADPLVTATVAADGGMLCVAAPFCVTLARLALRAPSLASAFGRVAATSRLLRPSDPVARASAATSAAPVPPGVGAPASGAALPVVMDGASLFSGSEAAADPSDPAVMAADAAAARLGTRPLRLVAWSNAAASMRRAGDVAAEEFALSGVEAAPDATACRAALSAVDVLASPPGCPEVVAAEIVAAAARRCAAAGLARTPDAADVSAAKAGRRAGKRARDSESRSPSAEWRSLLLDLLDTGRVDHAACPTLVRDALAAGRWRVVDAAVRHVRGLPERVLASILRAAVRAAASGAADDSDKPHAFVEWVRRSWQSQGVDIVELDEQNAAARAAAVAAGRRKTQLKQPPAGRALAATRGLEHVLVLCARRERNDVFLQSALGGGGLSGDEAAAALAGLTRLLRRFAVAFPERFAREAGTLPRAVVDLLAENAVLADTVAAGAAAGAAAAAAALTAAEADGAAPASSSSSSSAESPAEAAARAQAAAVAASAVRVAGDRRARRRRMDPATEAALAKTIASRGGDSSAGRSDSTPAWGSPLPDTPLPPLGRLLDWVRVLLDAAFPALLVSASSAAAGTGPAVGDALGVLRRLRGVVSELSSGAQAMADLRGHLAHTLQRLPHPEAALPGYMEEVMRMPKVEA